MQIRIQPFKYSALLLVVCFLCVIGIEAYLLYSHVYKNFNAVPEGATAENIVRLDLASYNKALEVLDRNAKFVLPSKNLVDSNPFK